MCFCNKHRSALLVKNVDSGPYKVIVLLIIVQSNPSIYDLSLHNWPSKNPLPCVWTTLSAVSPYSKDRFQDPNGCPKLQVVLDPKYTVFFLYIHI